jgi:hypothetical protein
MKKNTSVLKKSGKKDFVMDIHNVIEDAYFARELKYVLNEVLGGYALKNESIREKVLKIKKERGLA